MPQAQATIEDGSRNYAGYVEFDDHPTAIPCRRVADGFRLTLPARVVLPWPKNDQRTSVVRGLRCRISALVEGGGQVELGEAADVCGIYTPAKPQSEAQASLEWTAGLDALAYYEKLRNGGPPFFYLDVWGEHCYALSVQNETWRITTEPFTFHASLQLRLPAEVWSKMLEELGVVADIYFAIPVPTQPPSGWEAVWGHVLDARNGMRQGGSSGLKACATAVREALSQWQQIERENLGGWTPPSLQARQAMTLRERIDFLRWVVREVAHLGPHGTAGEWSRDEVLLLYSNLCALLAARRP